ncbi:hypothetical protein J6O48_11725 [bacterium]|nr:hypothetical protein [bacterium]
MTTVNAAQIKKFVREVDAKRKGGNGNGIVDGSEIELFTKKCKTAGLDNIDEIMDSYNKNRTQKEAEFEANGTTAESSVEAAVIAALTENTALRSNPNAKNSAATVKDTIKNSDDNFGWWNPLSWFNTNGDFDLFDPDTWLNDETELLGATKFVNSKNVLDVVADNAVLEKIEDADPTVKTQASNQVVDALVKAANEAQVDVSDIVKIENGRYVVGRSIDAEYGSPIENSFTEVVNALSQRVNEAKDALNGRGSKEQMLTIAAKKIDAEGNGNGYIDTDDEKEAFKQFAAEKGYDVDAILEEIRDNEANGVENTTNAQKVIFNIFDPEQRAAIQAAYEADDADIAKALADGIGEGNDDAFSYAWPSEVASFFSNLFEGGDVDWQDGNKDLLDKAIQNVNSDNVMTVLNKNPKLVERIMNKYSHNWFMNMFCDDKFDNYTNPILTALVEHAEENGIDVSDIVIVDENGNMMTGANSGVRAGKDATDEDYVEAVIKALQTRINAEEN